MAKLVYKVDNLNDKMDKIAEDVDHLKAEATAAMPQHTPLRIPKALSREVKRIHAGLGSDHKYKGNERFASEYNSEVTKLISQAIMDGDDFDASLIRRACNRYYENVKREFKLLVENKTAEDRRAKALNNRRHRVFSISPKI
ncbi:uncharacterized protein LOC115380144 isoform X2 [Myripristis murdjan]|uniref:uncharacterized protein LOC115380144 isoform X2 n=1 Tax=Myripristis murdjan TaxID=586833 RepID=UPI00117626F4|nr:uncharacterized protein LOC115380144 isoform X2 [Myripristis murdjan]XP_029937092.1 uncharacterized protein LOC115380144 isoform X2 [Myripristis murdjan]